MSPTVRYAIRAVLTGVSGAASSLLTAMPDLSLADFVTAGLLGVVFALGYAGIGAGSRTVEPEIGRGE